MRRLRLSMVRPWTRYRLRRSVLVKGVHRHDHSAARGKAVSEASMLADIRLMKRHNFTAVRTSHYPNAHRFYELCDRLGLYVVDEANVECHGMVPLISLLASDPEWYPCLAARMRRVVAHRHLAQLSRVSLRRLAKPRLLRRQSSTVRCSSSFHRLPMTRIRSRR